MSVEETRTTRISDAEPVVVHHHTTEVRETDGGGAAAWWIGAIVAIVAILAIVYFVTRAPDQSSLDNALEQGRLTGQLEASQGINSAAQSAQDAAQRASDAAARAADSVATPPAQPNITINNPPAEAPPVG